MRRLTLNNQVSQAPAMTPVGPSSADSSSFYGASLQGLKYSTYDGNRSQEEVKAFLDVFAVVRSLNSLSDKDLVRFVVHHLRGDALLWWVELSESNRSQHLLDDWTAFKSALRRRFVRSDAASTDTQKLLYGLRQIGSARCYFTQLRHSPLFFCKSCIRRNSSPQAANSLALFAPICLHLDKLPGTPVPTISAPLINTNSLISSPKQLVFEGTVNKNLITFLLDVGADHSIMTRALALTNGITMYPLDPPIATTFAKKSSEMIRFGTEPLQLQCQGHRSFVQPPVSEGVSFNLLVGHDWLQKNNPRIDWDHGSLMLFDSDQCYKWQAVYSDAEFHDEPVAIRLCTAR
ncbi:hypothetical protein Efla_001982 [Eimeria flavescens]